MTPLQEFQRLSKYARWNEQAGRRETWQETTTRYVDQLKRIADGRLVAEEFDEIEQAMLAMNVLGSMRLIAMAGNAFERDNVTAYNCAALPVNDFTSFHDATIISMSGGGVTYSVEKRFIDKLPVVKRQRDEWKNFLIPDSTEGWAQAIHYAVILAYEGVYATFDYSQIRPAGALLKTKGGRASGPQPLQDAIEAITAIIRNAQGRKLRPLELSDIFCHIGNASVCGGVRRTAMMALFDYGDSEMRQAKSGEWWKVAPVRSNANFSEVWPTESRLSYQEVSDALDAMFYGDSGEPGFFNRRAAIAKMPLRRASQLDENVIQNILVNPCLATGSLLFTDDKLAKIEDGGGNSFTSWETGYKECVLLKTNAGHEIVLTPDHRIMLASGGFIEAKDSVGKQISWALGNGKAGKDETMMLLGFLFGDGFICGGGYGVSVKLNPDKEPEIADLLQRKGFHLEQCGSFYANKDEIEEKLGYKLDFLQKRVYEREIPDWIIELPYERLGAFVSGLFEANGSMNLAGQGSIKATCKKMVQQLQIVLAAFGVQSWITENEMQPTTWANGTYTSRTSYNLQIAPRNAHFLLENIGIISKRKRENVKYLNKPYTGKLIVKSIDNVGVRQVWDFKMSVSGRPYNFANGIVAHNCGEAILIPRELCNLSVIVARPYDTEESLLLKAMIASRIGTIQAAATNFTTLLNPEWKVNCEFERLLGVGVTGWMDSKVSRNYETMQKMLGIIYDENKDTAKELGIGQAAALTAVKPAGNTGLLADVSSGIHARHYPFMLRRVTLNDHEPMFQVLRESGVPMEKSEWKEGQWYAQFPLSAPQGAITQDELTAIEQLAFTRQVMRNYVEHSVSVTISYEPGEEDAIKRYIHAYQDDFIGLSFFRKDRHFNQAPIEQITESEYNERVAKFPVIRWELLNEIEKEDYTQATSEIACGSGQCEIGDVMPMTFEVK